MPATVEELPEIKPTGDKNEDLFNAVHIRYVAKQNGYFVTEHHICTTGNVDAGKSGLTAGFKLNCGDLSDKVLKEEENRIIARKGEDYKPSLLEIATRSVEKGKEAKERGMTIEVKTHELPYWSHAVFPEGSDKWNKMLLYLKELGIQNEIVDWEDDEGKPCKAIKYLNRIIFADAPGHNNYIHNTSVGINVADIQFALFPSASGSGEGSEEQFLSAMQKGSTSMAHSRQGISQGNYMIFILSKTDFNTTEINQERYTTLQNVVQKKLGVKKQKAIIIPSSSQDLKCHNIFKHSKADFLNFYKGQEVEMAIKDYRNPTRVYNIKTKITTASDVFSHVMPQVCVKGQYQDKGTLVCVTDIVQNPKMGTIIIAQVLNGVCSIGDVLTSVHNKDCQYRVESMEQFCKSVKDSPVKSFIGMKLKSISKNKSAVTRHDLLHCDFPAHNIPVSSQYMEARMLFFPTESGSKIKDAKLGAEFTMVTIVKETICIVNVFSMKAGKDPEVKDSEATPINSWPMNSTILHGIVKFKHEEMKFPTITQATYGHTGIMLNSKSVAGSIKLVKHLPDGAKQDKVLIAASSKKKTAGKK